MRENELHRAMRTALTLWAAALLALPGCTTSEDVEPDRKVVVASKAFTESVILGETVRLLLSDAGVPAEHRSDLGGSRFLWEALVRGDIDAYPDYTGTIIHETLADFAVSDTSDLRAALAQFGIRSTGPLGFNNTYAIGLPKHLAEDRGIRTISDLANHPDLRLGFSSEFMDRADGWPGLQAHYGLPQQNVRGLQHDLAYRGLESGTLDATDLYSTDAEIEYYDLSVLEDDRGFFPDYYALILYREDLQSRAPHATAVIEDLTGRIDESTMVRMNARAKIDRVSEPEVAAGFLRSSFGIESNATGDSMTARVLDRTLEHLALVLISLTAAVLLAIPLGIWAAQGSTAGPLILGTVGVIYTIPALALLVFMIPLLGIGSVPAMVALFLYSLLPIVRNTHAGLLDIPAGARESALALGLPYFARLRRVELPMATPSILAGIKTAAVINVGTATLGALIGAGGYGQPILTGIRLDDTALILEGAVPAALLALLVQSLFDISERFLVPRGLRL